MPDAEGDSEDVKAETVSADRNIPQKNYDNLNSLGEYNGAPPAKKPAKKKGSFFAKKGKAGVDAEAAEVAEAGAAEPEPAESKLDDEAKAKAAKPKKPIKRVYPDDELEVTVREDQPGDMIKERSNSRDLETFKFTDMSDNKFFKENGYMYDMAMILPLATFDEAPPTKNGDGMSGHDIIQLLHFQGLGTLTYGGELRNQGFCVVKIRCSVKRLREIAQQFHYPMELDSERLREAAAKGSKNIAGFTIADTPKEIARERLDPYKHHFVPYNSDKAIEPLFKRHFVQNGHSHVFSSIHRIKLIDRLIKEPIIKGGCGMSPDVLMGTNSISPNGMFPLMDRIPKMALRNTWYTWDCVFKPWTVPSLDIREYYGAQIALYHSFLSHYATWSFFTGIAGLLVTVEWIVTPNSFVYRGIFMCCVSMWSVFMLEDWNRKETRLALRWGMTSLDSLPTRSDYDPKKNKKIKATISYIDGTEWLYFDPAAKQILKVQSRTTVVLMIVLVLAMIGSVFAYKILHQNRADMAFQIQILAPGVQAAFIVIMDMVYQKVAIWLTNREGHMTDLMYEDALIGKLFVFQFINNFSPLYYIAFIKQAVETNGCLFEGKCIIEVAVNLTMVAVVRFFVIGNIKEIALPLALKAVNAFKINAGPLSQLKQLLLGSPKPDEAAANADKKDKKKDAEAPSTQPPIKKPDLLTERMWRQLNNFFGDNAKRVVEVVKLWTALDKDGDGFVEVPALIAGLDKFLDDDWRRANGEEGAMSTLTVAALIKNHGKLTREGQISLDEFTSAVIKFNNKKKKENEKKKGAFTNESLLSTAEIQYQLPAYDLIEGLFADYEELGLLFAYSTLFVVACPPISFFALLLNCLEVRIDAYKLLHHYQRPIAVTANSIGTWKTIFGLVSIIAVVTNAGLLLFTIDVFPSARPATKVWGFYVFQVVVFVIMYAVSMVVSDTPIDVEIQLKRRDTLVNKVIRKIPDDAIDKGEMMKQMESQGILTGGDGQMDESDFEGSGIAGKFKAPSLWGKK